jgi:6-phosphogluconolactonase
VVATLSDIPTTEVAGAHVHVLPDPVATADAAAVFIAAAAKQAISDRGMFRLALSGGNTPRATYERLASPTLGNGIDWAQVLVFFGDERMVPPDDPSSNYRMARESLLDHIEIPSGNVFRIRGEGDPERAAEEYAQLLGTSPLDLVLLGIGDDGHVASLFPGTAALDVTDRKVLPNHAPVAPHERLTVSFGVINGARQVALLVTGKGKAGRVAQIFEQKKSEKPELPAARVTPTSGALHWFLDDAAASQLGLTA